MKKALWNPVIDLALALSFMAMVLTGFILRFTLPPGTNRLYQLWGLTRHQWGSFHFYASLLLLLVMTIHIFLHWQWIEAIVRKRIGLPARVENSRAGLWTVAILAVAFAAFAWATCSGRTNLALDGPPYMRGEVSRWQGESNQRGQGYELHRDMENRQLHGKGRTWDK